MESLLHKKFRLMIFSSVIFCIMFSSAFASESSSFQRDTSQNIQLIENANHQQNEEGSHGDRFASVYLFFFLIITGAVIGRRFIAGKLKQPEVLGELIIGVIVGIVLYQLNHPVMTLIRHYDDINIIQEKYVQENLTWEETIEKYIPEDAFTAGGYGQELEKILLDPGFSGYSMLVNVFFMFSSFGVLVLLFLVGLETSIEEMFEAGKTSMLVAILGVIFPMVFGYLTSMILIPGKNPNLYLFIGATLCATSIGITARVFKDLRKIHVPESKIILGAAVIDDVLGLIVLAVVAGIIESGAIQFDNIALILLKSVLFLTITFIIGKRYLRIPIKLAAIAEKKHVSLLFPFLLLMLLAWLSDLIGLASIVGAFAAGLIIKEEFFREFHKDSTKSVKSLIEPIEVIFAPVFFVIMGMQVDLSAFMKTEILFIALALTIVAIIGKLLSGIFVKGMDKKIIGIGMIPRGEVGLIFAGMGKTIGILDSSLFSAIIIVIILTTFVTPPGLKWAFGRYERIKS